MTDTEEQSDAPVSNMTDQDWQDVAESEFRDITESAMGSRVAFVFEHDELGLHGFQFDKKNATLKPCAFDEV